MRLICSSRRDPLGTKLSRYFAKRYASCRLAINNLEWESHLSYLLSRFGAALIHLTISSKDILTSSWSTVLAETSSTHFRIRSVGTRLLRIPSLQYHWHCRTTNFLRLRKWFTTSDISVIRTPFIRGSPILKWGKSPLHMINISSECNLVLGWRRSSGKILTRKIPLTREQSHSATWSNSSVGSLNQRSTTSACQNMQCIYESAARRITCKLTSLVMAPSVEPLSTVLFTGHWSMQKFK